jgi:lipoteichoic acid synthase
MTLLDTLLSRRDWVYLLSLLVPLAIYNLGLRAFDVASLPAELEFAAPLGLLRSDVFFDLAYALLWFGLFALARNGNPLRWAVVFFFHASAMLVVTVSTVAHQYLRQTGTTLGYGIVASWLPNFGDIQPILTQTVPLSSWMLLFAALSYAAFGPLLVTRAVIGRRGMLRGSSVVRRPASSLLGPLGLFFLALGFGFLSIPMGLDAASASTPFGRDPVVNVFLTGVRGAGSEGAYEDALAVEVPEAEEATIVPMQRTEKRNVVLIHLESTRAGATTPYNANLETTPFLNELAAEGGLLAQRAYTIVPHTSKAATSVNCGILPHLNSQATEAEPSGIPARCLAELLKGQGYGTVFFQSPTEDFEDRRGLVENFGYEEFYPLEATDPEGFEQTNYFGYEDDMMLGPSEEWLRERGDEPFLAQYLTGTGHHDYRCLSTRYGQEDFAEDSWVNRYLNCMRLQDIFLKNLFDQYKELGLYDETIFVVFGDHGEGLGEHGRYQHNDTVWEEGLKVPLLIHAPGMLEGGERVEGLSNLTDILPTVLDLLGYDVEDGEYPGYSLLRPLPEDRTLRFSCFHENQCMASIEGYEKYVYHYGNWPEEFFDLAQDPLEKDNLTAERGAEVDERREDLLAWRSRVNVLYRDR